MKKPKINFLVSVVGGILLVAAGVIFLMNNLGLIMLDWDVLIGPMFGIGGLVFLMVFILNTDEWWALIPAFVLMGIGIIVFMDQNMQAVADRWSGAVFLGFLGLAFFLIYITHINHWWAIIPGGVLLTLAGVTLVPGEGDLSGVIFFFGLALTFGLVYILPKPSGRLKWALYPAGILLLIAVLVGLGAANLMNYVLPAALLIAGGFVIYQSLRRK